MNPRYSEQKKNFTYGTGGFTVTSFDCMFITQIILILKNIGLLLLLLTTIIINQNQSVRVNNLNLNTEIYIVY